MHNNDDRSVFCMRVSCDQGLFVCFISSTSIVCMYGMLQCSEYDLPNLFCGPSQFALTNVSIVDVDIVAVYETVAFTTSVLPASRRYYNAFHRCSVK